MAYIMELTAQYKRRRVKDDLIRQSASSSERIYTLFRYLEKETREKVICVHLNPVLEILSYEIVALGTAQRSLLDMAGLFRGILLSRASRIVVIHNHPLGVSSPSRKDKQISDRIKAASALYEIPMIDFMIIGEDGYYSFDEAGLL